MFLLFCFVSSSCTGFHDVTCIVLSTLSGSIPIKVTDTTFSPVKYSTTFPTVHSCSGKESCLNSTGLIEYARSCGIDLPACVLYELAQSHFADCLKSDFWDLQTVLRLSLFPLIKCFDPIVYEHFMNCEMELPYFAIPWVRILIILCHSFN
jgi:hypothetical protein